MYVNTLSMVCMGQAKKDNNKDSGCLSVCTKWDNFKISSVSLMSHKPYCVCLLSETLPDCDGHGCDPELDVLAGAEVDGDECEPDDAGGVHAEADELGLVEGLGDLARQHRVEGAHDHQQDRVREGDHVRRVHRRLQTEGTKKI